MQTTSITFTAPNLNALRSQMTAFLGEDVSSPTAPAVSTTAARTTRAPKAAKPVEAEEEFDLDAEEVVESDDETDVSPADEDETSIDDVVAAFKKYATAKPANKVKAQGILKTLGVKSVRDIKPAQYAKAISLLK